MKNIFDIKAISDALNTGKRRVEEYSVFNFKNTISKPTKVIDSYFDNFIPKYTPDEALVNYMSSSSYKVNEALRNQIPLTSEHLSLISGLDKKLDSLPDRIGSSYRFYSFDTKDEFDKFIAQHKIGNEILCYIYYKN